MARLADHGFFGNFIGIPGEILGHRAEQGQAAIPLATLGPGFRFPQATLAYFQFVFAGITPMLMLGSVLGRINLKAWVPFVLLWSSIVYTVDAFTIWGGGFFAQHGAIDFSGGYVIHMSAGVSGFVAAEVVGPRLQRDREIDAPNNVAMVAIGAGLLWMGWNGFNGGDPYFAGAVGLGGGAQHEPVHGRRVHGVGRHGLPHRAQAGLISGVNGMIVGLVAITPAAGYVNGWGARDRHRRRGARLLRAQLHEPHATVPQRR